MPKRILEIIYKTTILSCIGHADTVWGTCSTTLLKTAQRLQNAAARIILKNYDYVNVRGEDLVRMLDWQTIEERQRFHTAILMFKCVHGLCPAYMSDQVTFLNEVNVYNTRATNGLNVLVPHPEKDIFKRSFLYNGAILWNSLPEFLKESESVHDFKSKYKVHYFSK